MSRERAVPDSSRSVEAAARDRVTERALRHRTRLAGKIDETSDAAPAAGGVALADDYALVVVAAERREQCGAVGGCEGPDKPVLGLDLDERDTRAAWEG